MALLIVVCLPFFCGLSLFHESAMVIIDNSIEIDALVLENWFSVLVTRDISEGGVNLKAIALFENLRFWLIAQESGHGGLSTISNYFLVLIEKTGPQIVGSEIARFSIPTPMVDEFQEANPEPAGDNKSDHAVWQRKLIAAVIFEGKLLSQFPDHLQSTFEPYIHSLAEHKAITASSGDADIVRAPIRRL